MAAECRNSGLPDLYEIFHANFEVVLADTPELVNEALALRYQVYCIEREYEDPAENPGGHEHDAFDDRSVHALVRHRRSGECAGGVRLVLADSVDPANAFPIELCCAGRFDPGVPERIEDLPRRQVAEISRFAVSRHFRRRFMEDQFIHGLSPHVSYSDLERRQEDERRRIMPQVTVGLFAAVLELSVRHGVTHWFAVMEPVLLRLLRRFGIDFPTIGPLVQYHGRRRPTLAVGREVMDKARLQRPDVWNFVTDGGKHIIKNP